MTASNDFIGWLKTIEEVAQKNGFAPSEYRIGPNVLRPLFDEGLSPDAAYEHVWRALAKDHYDRDQRRDINRVQAWYVPPQASRSVSD